MVPATKKRTTQTARNDLARNNPCVIIIITIPSYFITIYLGSRGDSDIRTSCNHYIFTEQTKIKLIINIMA